MHNGTIAYQLPTFTGLMNDGWSRTSFVRDMDDQKEVIEYDLQARIRSGDYFITLATTLDQLGRDINDNYVRTDIEDVVSDLISLQDHYRITKK